MSAGDGDTLVLTWHSISGAAGPTCIDATTFAMQLEVLAESGWPVVGAGEYIAAHPATTARRALITFDDGFADFATTALPLLQRHGFAATVFVPTGRIGGCEDWEGANVPARPLLDWSAVRALAGAGIEFGGHGVTHADLTRLPPDRRRQEIRQCAQDLGRQTGRPARFFAAPYGSADAAVRSEIAEVYAAAFGTRFDVAAPGCDRFDVPRIEMHYFRQRRHWQAFLQGRRGYFLVRRALRWGRLAARAWRPGRAAT